MHHTMARTWKLGDIVGIITSTIPQWLQLGLGGAALFISFVSVLAIFYIAKSIILGLKDIVVELKSLANSITDLVARNEKQDKYNSKNNDKIESSIRRIHERLDDVATDVEVVRVMMLEKLQNGG